MYFHPFLEWSHSVDVAALITTIIFQMIKCSLRKGRQFSPGYATTKTLDSELTQGEGL